MARHGIRNTFMPPTALQADAPGRKPAGAPRLPAALDRHRRRAAGRGHDGLGPRDLRLRARASSTARPRSTWWSATARACFRSRPARWVAPSPATRSRWWTTSGSVLPPGTPRHRRRAPARPGDVPAVLEAAGGDRRQVPRRLVPARRRRRQGRGRPLLVPGPRRRHHQLGRLPHRPRRGGGVPVQAPSRGAGRRDRRARSDPRRGGRGLHRAGQGLRADARRWPRRSRCS